MLEFEERVLDMDMARIDNDFHTFLEFLSISNEESEVLGLTVESTFDVVKTKLKNIGRKIIEAIHRFIYNAILKVATKMEEYSINSKLKEIKSGLIEKRINNSDTITYMDIRKYKKSYTEFIHTYVKEIEAGMHKNFKSKADFKEWESHMISKLDKFNGLLSKEEKWKLSTAINKAVEASEDNTGKIKDSFITINRDSKDIIEKLTNAISSNKQYEKDDCGNEKQSLIGYLMRKISQLVRTVVSFIFKHTFLCITAIIVAIAAQ